MERHAISRAAFFLTLAEGCGINDRERFEVFLEASIVFGRTAIHRLKTQFEKHPEWKKWFDDLRGNAAVEFFRGHRDFILKEGPPRVDRIITGNPIRGAAELYYFEDAAVPATDTVHRHLETLATLVRDAEARFSAATAE